MAKKKPKAKKKAAPSTDPDELSLEVLEGEGKQIVRNKVDGQFRPGTNSGGRPRGSVDGVALVRALFTKHLEEMSASGAEFDQLLAELRTTKGGVWRLLKMGLAASRDEERAKAGGVVNVSGARSINIVIVEETPPAAKQVESRVVEADGNGKAS